MCVQLHYVKNTTSSKLYKTMKVCVFIMKSVFVFWILNFLGMCSDGMILMTRKHSGNVTQIKKFVSYQIVNHASLIRNTYYEWKNKISWMKQFIWWHCKTLILHKKQYVLFFLYYSHYVLIWKFFINNSYGMLKCSIYSSFKISSIDNVWIPEWTTLQEHSVKNWFDPNLKIHKINRKSNVFSKLF